MADPESEGAALAGSPNSQIHIPCTADDTEPVRDFQAASLRRLFGFCKATACTIASLAFAVVPR
jgi:hypothetical protein